MATGSLTDPLALRNYQASRAFKHPEHGAAFLRPAIPRADYTLGRLGEAGPPPRFSLAEGTRRPWAVRESVVDDVEASMATVPSRTGDGRPVRPPVAMPASGLGVVGCTVATPRLVTVMWV